MESGDRAEGIDKVVDEVIVPFFRGLNLRVDDEIFVGAGEKLGIGLGDDLKTLADRYEFKPDEKESYIIVFYNDGAYRLEDVSNPGRVRKTAEDGTSFSILYDRAFVGNNGERFIVPGEVDVVIPPMGRRKEERRFSLPIAYIPHSGGAADAADGEGPPTIIDAVAS